MHRHAVQPHAAAAVAAAAVSGPRAVACDQRCGKRRLKMKDHPQSMTQSSSLAQRKC